MSMEQTKLFRDIIENDDLSQFREIIKQTPKLIHHVRVFIFDILLLRLTIGNLELR
jgi:hypothetical protein